MEAGPCSCASHEGAVASLTQPNFCPNPSGPGSAKTKSIGRYTLPSSDCYPIDVTPGLSRLFLDFCAGIPGCGRSTPLCRARRDGRSDLLSRAIGTKSLSCWPGKIPRPQRLRHCEALRAGAGTVVTGQQVGLLGGPLFTPFKAATALARARQATAAGNPHVAIFWLATEDHDFAEINHVTFPPRKELKKLVYAKAPANAVPVGGVVLDETIEPLMEQAWELLGSSDAMDALAAAYKPGRTFGQAFAEFYAKAFAAQGLLVLDAAGSEVHRMGAPVLRAAIERADELHAALLERNKALEAAGYHAQVAVAPQSSLLFLIDERNGRAHGVEADGAECSRAAWAVAGGARELYDGGFAGHSGGRAGADFARGAATASVSGFSAGNVADCRRAGGDCLFCAVGGAVRAHSGARTTAAEPSFRER